jgi:galactokinase
VGDRAILRYFHFIDENRRVGEQSRSLKEGDMERFLSLVQSSGDSSWKLLQNTYSPGTPENQGIPLALALSKKILKGKGACRVHGGGFAGTIQAYVPKDQTREYRGSMESVFGAGSVTTLKIRNVGIISLTCS